MTSGEQIEQERMNRAFAFYDAPLSDGGRVACHCGRCGWKAYAANYSQAKDVLDAHEAEFHRAPAIGSERVENV